MRSEARTAEDYVADLPPHRRDLIETVVDEIRNHLPSGYEESVDYGMLVWSVPLERYPATYNKKPLGYLALASQKQYCALYLNLDPADEPTFRQRWVAGGRKLDMGRSCLRFRSLDDLDLELLREAIASTSVDEYISRYEASRASTASATE
jgi:hypothetical protein